MQDILTTIIWLSPVIGFIINGLFGGHLGKSLVGIIGTGAVFISFICTAILFVSTQTGFDVQYFNWISVANVNIPFALHIDQLSLTMLLVITGVGSLIHLYSAGYMHDDAGIHKFFTYLNLFIFSMCILVMGANLPMIFIGWEGVGLCSFLLIGFWHKNKDYNAAAQKAFVMNRIGDLGFIIAMFLIAKATGTLTISEIISNSSAIGANTTITTAITLLLFLAATGKSAQIPLFTWLPDAMAGPTPVSALIHAATMVTAGIYLVARMHDVFLLSPFTMHIILIIGVATALFAALIALKQNDIKKVLAYSTVSQLGYMFAALGVGAFSTAIFHVVTHAFFKALLFLGAGSVIHAMHGEQNIRNMGGLRKALPVTHLTFLIGTLAIAGVPPLAGFFSKDEILAVVHGSHFWFFVVLAVCSVCTAIYMFKLYFLTFSGKFRGTADQEKHLHESPMSMTLPLIILAMLSVFGGFLGMPELFHQPHLIGNYLGNVLKDVDHHVSHSFEIALIITSIITLAGLITWLYVRYVKQNHLPSVHPENIQRVMANKFYVDEIYDAAFVKPTQGLSKIFHDIFDRKLIDGIVNGVGSLTKGSAEFIRGNQNGLVGSYIINMVGGIILIIAIFFIFKAN